MQKVNPGLSSSAPARILIIDDEDLIRDTVALALTDEGYQVVTAESGQRAVELMFPAADSSRHLLEHYGFAHARSLRFKRIGNSGHYMMLEQPIMTASVLLAFGVTADYTFEN